MSAKLLVSSLCIGALLFSTEVSPARAQEKPEEAAQALPRGYSMPSLFPLYSSPPVRFSDNRLIVIRFRTTPEVIRDLVPKPLLPNPDSLMFIYFGGLNMQHAAIGEFKFLEMGIGIPVVFPETMTAGNYAVCLYLNNALPIILGREIWGWPKKDAEITFSERDGQISGRVERLGTVLLGLTAKPQKKLDPGPDPPKKVWFLQKIIPSARKNAPPDVWQLVSSVNVDNLTKELWDCTAKLEFATGPEDPLGNIKVLEIVSAQFSVGNFAIDYGEVLHDYLLKK